MWPVHSIRRRTYLVLYRNRERLAAKARGDRKTAFVAKHGFRAYLNRRLDNL
jgi:hypothetical protein